MDDAEQGRCDIEDVREALHDRDGWSEYREARMAIVRLRIRSLGLGKRGFNVVHPFDSGYKLTF